MGYSRLLLGQASDSLQWLQRALAGGAMSRPIWRARCCLYMASAYALTGNMEEARRALAEASRLWPFATVRGMAPAITGPRGLPGPALKEQFRRVQEGLRLAGLRDHADENADFGVAPVSTLQTDLIGPTPTMVPGVTTLRTGELVELLERQRPTLIDVALETWGCPYQGRSGCRVPATVPSFPKLSRNDSGPG